MKAKKIFSEMNDQVRYEFESAYLYLAMAASFHEQGLDGMAQWMRVQALEEQVHAMKFFDHLRDRNVAVKLQPLSLKKAQWKTPLEAFQDAYEHEQFITSRINLLVDLAQKESDHAAMPLLHWFINEQIEEEANTSKIAATLERLGPSGEGLIMLDRELGARVFTPPPGTPELGPAAGA